MAIWHKAALAVTLGLAVATIGGYAWAQEDAIKARKDGFQVFRVSMGAVKKVVDDNGPASAAVAPAEAIAAQAGKQLQHFPAGSDKGTTKAKPEIWAQWATFEANMKDLESKAAATVTAAKAGNMDGVKAGFAAMGGACGACHKSFRND